ncbi:MAG: Kelch repeat-containing protein [Planctomycetota bacterium]|jgi:hypothetical protein
MLRLTLSLIATLFAGTLAAQSFSISGSPASGLPDVDGKIWDVLEHNGKLYIAGEFTTVGTTARNRLAEIDLTNNQVTNWNPDPDLFCTSLAVHNNVLYVGGGFTQLASQARVSLASFDLSTGAITSWSPTCSLPAGATNIFFNDDVHVLKLSGDVLYVGGGFTAIDGTPRGHACSFDLTNLGTANGLTVWDPNIIGSIGTGSPSFGSGGLQGMYIDSMNNRCIMTGGILEAGGDHWHDSSSSGHASAYGYTIVASSIGTGAPDPNWAPQLVTGAAAGNTAIVNTCHGIAGNAYVSGLFTGWTSGGVTENRLFGAGFDLSGNSNTSNIVTPFDPNPDMRIWAWETDPADSVLFAGGEFNNIGGQSYARLAMLDPSTGAAVGSWNPAPDAAVRAIHFAGNRLYVAGEFTTIGGQSRARLAAFDVVFPTNAIPTVTVTSLGSPVSPNDTINVVHTSTLNMLNLRIDVTDTDGDNVGLVGSVSDIGTTGILTGEFNNAATAPYSVTPTTGAFNDGGVLHTITLSIDDGKGGTALFTFHIQVGTSSDGAGGGSGGGAGGCASGSESGIWLLLGLLTLVGGAAYRRQWV